MSLLTNGRVAWDMAAQVGSMYEANAYLPSDGWMVLHEICLCEWAPGLFGEWRRFHCDPYEMLEKARACRCPVCREHLQQVRKSKKQAVREGHTP